MGIGRCYICNDTYLDGGITRHIKTCLGKKSGAKINRNNINDSTYLIKIQDKYDKGYYLYLLVDGCVLLSEMDQYLRDIWVECCGHLSSFIINGIDYERYIDPTWGNAEDMEIEIDKVLHCGMSFSYIYDYGSTTELELKVIEKYEPLFGNRGIHLIVRNMPMEYKCDYCNNKAAFQFDNVNSGELGIVCNSCMERMQSDNEEIYFSDMVNSPRTGVCGYGGPADDILFMEHKKLKNKKRKSVSREPHDNFSFIEKLLSGEITEEDMEYQEDFNNLLSRIANLARYRQRSLPPFMIARYKLEGYMLKDYLSLLRKNELDIIRKNLNIEKASGLKKDELIEHINQFLLENIENELTFLLSNMYDVLMKIYEFGEAFWEQDEYVPELLINLRNKGLLFTVCEDDEQYEWVIPDDIKIALGKLIANDGFQKRRMLSNNICEAMVCIFFYWGIVKKYDLLKETARLLDISIDDEFILIFEEIFKNMVDYIDSEKIGSTEYYYMFVDDATTKILSSEWQQANYPLITKDMISEKDKGWIGLILHNPYFKWVCELAGQAEDDEFDLDDAYDMVTGMAGVSFNIKPGTDVRQLATKLEMGDEIFKVPFMLELLNNILKYSPNYWLKGNSISGEIHVNNEKYKGWSPQTLSSKNSAKSKNSSGVAASRWKIGRNDPCPCGSGKKYKKCCGR